MRRRSSVGRAGFLALAILLSGNTVAPAADSATGDSQDLYSFREPHMGTEFTIRAWAHAGEVEELKLVVKKAFERVSELNQICSDYLPESEINDFARAPVGVPIPVSKDLYAVFDRSVSLSEETDGAFDVTAGPLIRLWRLSRKNRSLPDAERIARAKSRTGSHLIELDARGGTITKRGEGMLFDLGGIAKGYAADAALEILREGGFSRVLVAASGDIVVGDPPPGKSAWRVGIESLELVDDALAVQTVLLANRAISTSGDTRQYLEFDGVRYSHIVSTTTGLGLTDRIAVTVIASDATTSDSHATAVSLLGRKEGLQFIENKREIECQIVTLQNGQEVVTRSDGFARFAEEENEENSPVPSP